MPAVVLCFHLPTLLAGMLIGVALTLVWLALAFKL